MPRFEVLCPASPPALPGDVTLRLDAEHWLAALEAGLQRLGEGPRPAHLLCDVQPDGAVRASDPAGGGIFRIRELRDAAPAAAEVPPPAPRAEDVLPARPAAAALAGQGRQAGLERLLALALEAVDAEAGSVLLVRAGGRELEFVAVQGPRARELAALRAAVPVGAGIVGFCVREDVCLAVSDARRDPRFHRAISELVGYETRSILCAPIRRGARVLGALEVLNKRGGRGFGAEDLSALSALAREAAEHLARTGG